LSACDGLTRPAFALVRAWGRRPGPPVTALSALRPSWSARDVAALVRPW